MGTNEDQCTEGSVASVRSHQDLRVLAGGDGRSGRTRMPEQYSGAYAWRTKTRHATESVHSGNVTYERG